MGDKNRTLHDNVMNCPSSYSCIGFCAFFLYLKNNKLGNFHDVLTHKGLGIFKMPTSKKENAVPNQHKDSGICRAVGVVICAGDK